MRLQRFVTTSASSGWLGLDVDRRGVQTMSLSLSGYYIERFVITLSADKKRPWYKANGSPISLPGANTLS